jgi:putative tryptophan/tyrosine transport system substrate-binding protein
MSEVRKHSSGSNHQRHGTERSLRAVCRSVLKPIFDLGLLISGLCALLFALCFSAQAQQPKKVPRLGVLAGGSAVSDSARIEALRQGLRELGYVERKNIVIEYEYADGNFNRLTELAARLVHLRVEVIVTAGPSATRAAKQTTTTIPIVMAQDSDPIASGLVASLARPGGNITGLSRLSPELSGKQLELLKETVPTLSQLAVFENSTQPGNRQSLNEVELAAGALGVRLQTANISGPKDIQTAFRAASKGRANGLLVLSSPVLFAQRTEVVELAAKNRLPAIYFALEFAEDGGLMSYGPSITDLFHRAATYVDKILKGARPAEVPVEQPKKFELIINLKAAKKIGLTIPPNVLARADKVIK